MNKLAWFIGYRYVRTRKGNGWAVSIFSIISVLGISLGVAALIVVLSVMNGVTSEVRDKMLTMTAHAKILVFKDDISPSYDISTVIPEGIKDTSHIKSYSPYVDGEAVIGINENFIGVRIKGIDPNKEIDVTDALKPNKKELMRLKPNSYQVIIGSGLSSKLGVGVGDKVTIIVPKVQVGITGILPRIKRMTVIGIFDSGHYTYDNGMMFTHIEDSMRLFQKRSIDGFQLKLDDLWSAKKLTEKLNNRLSRGFYAINWTDENKAYFEAVKIEKGAMFLILLIILLVATFNVVSTLIMVVNDKTSDIAILRTLGMPRYVISKIFIIQGMLLGILGTVMGVLLGIFISINIPNLVKFLESNFSISLPQELYFITSLKAEIDPRLILFICFCSIFLSFLATLLPAVKASSVNPARALAYE